MACFQRQISPFEKFIAAIRTAQLEIEGNYIPEIHDEYILNFSWEQFTQEELSAIPPVILISESKKVTHTELASIAALMAKKLPIKLLSLDKPFRPNLSGGEPDPFESMAGQSLGAMAMGYRGNFVLQSPTISPKYMYEGISKGMLHHSLAVFNILCSSDIDYLNPHLWGSAAVESRHFPLFTYSGNLNKSWGSRFDISNNPGCAVTWPNHTLQVINGKKEEEWNIPFCFPDFALVKSLFAPHFMEIESQFWNDDLIPFATYLDLDSKSAQGKIPFIWAVNVNHELTKVVVSDQLTEACREKVEYWEYLQENAGINNYHVEKAIAKEKEQIKAEANKEVIAVRTELTEEIERVRKEAVGEAMDRLTNYLLNLDEMPASSQMSIKPNKRRVEKVISESETPDVETVSKEEAEEEMVMSSDPWIETELCTTCNECTDLNSKMFNYNDEKMAFLADATAGTFAELVTAAEVCPVGIIHPGDPINKKEANLDELIKRAEKFN
jgi:ferredoxin